MNEIGAQGWRLVTGDAFERIAGLPARSVDAVVTDPPYGIGFRGEPWDRHQQPSGRQQNSRVRGRPGFEEWTRAWALECLRVLKPGGYLLAFGSPRTVHRLTSGIEAAGLEIRDQLLWLYGSGVPKSPLRNGRSSTLKPGYEPIVLARAPLVGSTTANEQQFGTSRLSIDETRIDSADAPGGRWPSNLALSHRPSCQPKRCSRACPVSALDHSYPRLRPSRFYYCAKPSRRERDAGCEHLPARSASVYGHNSPKPRRNTHPTVKPAELMGWLVRLVTPPNGLVLDPFAGSGSTGVACLAEGRRFLGIEQDSGYARIARARLTHQQAQEQPQVKRRAA